MKALIVGYGSAGKRHLRVLSKIKAFSEIDLVTNQNISGIKIYRRLEDVPLVRYDYIVIASETSKHYEQLKYITENVENRLILCEKPLFCKSENILSDKNMIFVGYQLRYHPLIVKLNDLINNEKVFFCKVYCGYYLPYWRTNRELQNTYSASKERCGGVLLDLSHEIDYTTLLFGQLRDLKGYMGKISNLPIDSEDFLSIVGITDRGIYVCLTLDYISKIRTRLMVIHTEESSIIMDMIEGNLQYKNKKGEIMESVGEFDSDLMTEKMHLDILTNREHVCSFDQAMRIMDIIDFIRSKLK